MSEPEEKPAGKPTDGGTGNGPGDAPGSAESGSGGEGDPVGGDGEVEAPRLVRVVAAVVLIVLSGTFLVGVFDIRSPKGLDPAGPRFFPLVVTGAWLLLSIGYLVEGLRAGGKQAAGGHRRAWVEPVAVSGLLVAYAFLVVPLGYMLSTAALFFAAARVLGSRQLGRDLVVSVVLAVAVYLAFTQFLDISLPEGVLGL